MNTGMMHSILQRAIVEENGYSTYTLNEVEWCPLRIVSAYDSSIECEHIFKIGFINKVTPAAPLPSSVVNLYQNISLADEEFYQCGSIDVILGMDIYNRLVLPGTISKTGQPDATNTIFGYVVSGAFFK